MKNSNAPCGCCAWFVAATMSSSDRESRIWASSKTSTSILSKPRPNPCERAPNMMIDPLWKTTSPSPFAVRIADTYGATRFRRAIPCIARNVFVVVRIWCDVQITRNPGYSKHIATSNAMTKNVLPTCRGIDSTTPPTVAAYLSFFRRPNTSCASPCCHRSNSIPIDRSRRCTRGHAVVTIPGGTTRCRATSDSRRVEVLVVGPADIPGPLLLRTRIQQTDLLIDLPELAYQLRQIRRRNTRIDLVRSLLPERHQQRTLITLGSLSDRLRRLHHRGLLIRRDRTKRRFTLTCHGRTSCPCATHFFWRGEILS